MNHIEWHKAMHEQQMQIKARVRLLGVAIGASLVAFVLGLYIGGLGK